AAGDRPPRRERSRRAGPTRRRPARRRWRWSGRIRGELQLDDVALGVAGVDGEPQAAGTIAERGLADHLDAFRLEVTDHGAHVRVGEGEADVVDVGRALAVRLGGWQQVDHAASGTQLDEADRL